MQKSKNRSHLYDVFFSPCLTVLYNFLHLMKIFTWYLKTTSFKDTFNFRRLWRYKVFLFLRFLEAFQVNVKGSINFFVLVEKSLLRRGVFRNLSNVYDWVFPESSYKGFEAPKRSILDIWQVCEYISLPSQHLNVSIVNFEQVNAYWVVTYIFSHTKF